VGENTANTLLLVDPFGPVESVHMLDLAERDGAVVSPSAKAIPESGEKVIVPVARASTAFLRNACRQFPVADDQLVARRSIGTGASANVVHKHLGAIAVTANENGSGPPLRLAARASTS